MHSPIMNFVVSTRKSGCLVSKVNRLDQKYKVYLVIMGLLNVNCGLPLFIFSFLSFSVSVSPTFH